MHNITTGSARPRFNYVAHFRLSCYRFDVDSVECVQIIITIIIIVISHYLIRVFPNVLQLSLSYAVVLLPALKMFEILLTAISVCPNFYNSNESGTKGQM